MNEKKTKKDGEKENFNNLFYSLAEMSEAKERALRCPIGKHTFEEAVKIYLYEIRCGR
jgi:hypothetical protein